MTQSKLAFPHNALFPSLQTVVNVASVPQRSPFRYPGGKTWLVPQIRRWLLSQIEKPLLFIEPFAGGGIAGLTSAFEDFVDKVIFVEVDENVSAVWRTILNGRGELLAQRIIDFDLTAENINAIFRNENRSLEDKAFATILKNRVQHGGIMASGASLMKKGENGRGIRSRWYPLTIAKRIRDICAIRKRFKFIQGDGFSVIREYAEEPNAIFFVDPPYTMAGSRLYKHSNIAHESLFKLMSEVAGDILLTYDDTPEVRKWARNYGLEVETVAMKSRQNQEKNELLIGKNLSWARD